MSDIKELILIQEFTKYDNKIYLYKRYNTFKLIKIA